MLKKWINSGVNQHSLICDSSDSVYHGGTGLIFDIVNLIEEETRPLNPDEFAKRPLSIKIKTNSLSTKASNRSFIEVEDLEEIKNFTIHKPKISSNNLMHEKLIKTYVNLQGINANNTIELNENA